MSSLCEFINMIFLNVDVGPRGKEGWLVREMGIALPLLTIDTGSWFCSFIKCIFLKVDVGSGKGDGFFEGRVLPNCARVRLYSRYG